MALDYISEDHFDGEESEQVSYEWDSMELGCGIVAEASGAKYQSLGITIGEFVEECFSKNMQPIECFNNMLAIKGIK
jgi:hypothetical protein